MGCQKCKKKSCSGGCSSEGKDLAQIKNELAELRDIVSDISVNAKFLLCGHPILLIQNEDDVESFNLDTGLGTGCWEGWAVCDGQEQYSNNAEELITTPNFLNKFILGASVDNPVNSTGGAETVTLTLPQIPSHNHSVIDPGHTHDIQDPGHSHGGSSGAHTHTITGAPHTHTVGTDGTHNHSLGTNVFGTDYNGGTGPFGLAVGYLGSGTNYGPITTATDGAHTHSLSSTTATSTASSTTSSVTIASAFVGITETEAAGAGITLVNSGGGEAHNNMPPYYCAIYVMKL